MSIEIKSYFEAKTKPISTWSVDYVETVTSGCCGSIASQRKTISLVQKKKPTQTQVENAINQSKDQSRG